MALLPGRFAAEGDFNPRRILAFFFQTDPREWQQALLFLRPDFTAHNLNARRSHAIPAVELFYKTLPLFAFNDLLHNLLLSVCASNQARYHHQRFVSR
jgi:hypothetical protein